MENFIKRQEMYLKEAILACGYNVEEVILVESSRPEFGDYQYNGVMNLAKEYKKNPREIAGEILEQIKSNSSFKDVNVAGPGFINISFSDEALINYMNEIMGNLQINVNNYDKRKIVLDYGGANVAKVLHVGHLRSANIGEALKRLLQALGHEVISDVHLGDFGRQMGMVILELKNRYPDLPYFDDNFDGVYPEESPITNEDLEELYPIANTKAKENADIMEEARLITVELQKGKPGYVALWRHIVNTSVKGIKEIYDLLNTSFDYWYGESDSNNYVPELCDYLEEKGLVEESEGAKVINVQKEDDLIEVPPFMLIKSNGSISYETTDLATIWQRKKDFNPDEIWYVVDNRQKLHFDQTFRAAYKSNIVDENVNLEFVGFGTMNGSDGKPFKTRDGGVMSLDNLITLVKDEIRKIMKDNVKEEEREQTIEDIAISALKYADLCPNRSTDYVFDPVKFCDATGKTGPYLLYTTIRIKSLLEKAGSGNWSIKNIYNDYDKNVILNILKMPKAIDNSYKAKSLNDICDYLYKLSNSYNNFYADNRILTETDSEKRESWLALSKLVYDINMYLLDILAIKVPNKM